MAFFEPLPSPPPNPPSERAWGPPLWDRPSEGTVPAILPVGEFVHRGDGAVAQIDELRVYPNGFTISMLILTNPRRVLDHAERRGFFGDPHGYPRIGVRFADGGRAGQRGWFGAPHDAPKDDAGVPTVPILRPMGGGGGSHEFHVRAWVFPLPPDGPVEVFVALPGVEGEGRATIDGAAIRSAAADAVVIWS